MLIVRPWNTDIGAEKEHPVRGGDIAVNEKDLGNREGDFQEQ